MSKVENGDFNKTPLQLAKEELQKERSEKAKLKIKEKLRELEKAKLVVQNIERELDDLVEQVNQGDI